VELTLYNYAAILTENFNIGGLWKIIDSDDGEDKIEKCTIKPIKGDGGL